jgi:hypothetical protein
MLPDDRHFRPSSVIDIRHDSSPGNVREYCEREQFEAQCADPNHVVVIRSAVYGIMRIGRCVQTNFGALGCSADVTKQVFIKNSAHVKIIYRPFFISLREFTL